MCVRNLRHFFNIIKTKILSPRPSIIKTENPPLLRRDFPHPCLNVIKKPTDCHRFSCSSELAGARELRIKSRRTIVEAVVNCRPRQPDNCCQFFQSNNPVVHGIPPLFKRKCTALLVKKQHLCNSKKFTVQSPPSNSMARCSSLPEKNT